jgi:hypothetical protein
VAGLFGLAKVPVPLVNQLPFALFAAPPAIPFTVIEFVVVQIV